MTKQSLPSPAPEDAREIYQTHLDVSTRLVATGDTRGYIDHATLPFVFRTAAGSQVIETFDDLAEDIRLVGEWLRAQGVSDYHRIARGARFVDSDTIEGFHVTYALRGAIPVVEPYANRMVLRRADGMWKVSFAEHELAEALYPNSLARAAPGAFAPEWSNAPDAVTRDQNDALPIYKGVLDDMSEAISRWDFDDWIALFTMPHSVHYHCTDHVVSAPDQAWEFFAELRAGMVEAGADWLTRVARFATFIADDRVLGYHKTTMTRNGEVRFGPIQSRMIMSHDGARWKCSAVTNSLSNVGFPGGAFQPSETLPTLREIEKRIKR